MGDGEGTRVSGEETNVVGVKVISFVKVAILVGER